MLRDRGMQKCSTDGARAARPDLQGKHNDFAIVRVFDVRIAVALQGGKGGKCHLCLRSVLCTDKHNKRHMILIATKLNTRGCINKDKLKAHYLAEGSAEVSCTDVSSALVQHECLAFWPAYASMKLCTSSRF
jgi:hypothetical protein